MTNELKSFNEKWPKTPDQLKEEAKKAHGLRYNDGKLKWSYVNFEALEPMVRVLMFGAQKYEPFNWMKGLDKKEVLESMQRHLAKLMDGENNDPESNLHHIGHIMCNAMFYSYFNNQENKNEIIQTIRQEKAL